MQKFITKSICFICCLPILFWGLLFIPKKNVNHQSYVASMIDKHDRLDSISSPKIILAGDSNITFGVDSKMLEEEFSLPIVNLSLHAGYGTSFVIEELKQSLQPNDVVLISFTYFLKDGQPRFIKKTAEIFPKAYNYCDFHLFAIYNYLKEDIQENCKQVIRSVITPKNRKTTNQQYISRDGFNDYGDYIGHLEKEKVESSIAERKKLEYRYWDNGIEGLNALFDHANRINAHVFYFYPSYSKSEYIKNKIPIQLLEKDLKNEVKVEIVNTPESFAFDDRLFYDTDYHLHKKGRQMRTKKMIQLLNNNRRFKQIKNLIK